MTKEYKVSSDAITSFRGDFAFLSNFYQCEIVLDGLRYPSVEHAFQAQKTLDTNMQRRIAVAVTASEAKRLGRSVKLRHDWEEKKVGIMHNLLLPIKFSPTRNPGLAKRLLKTKDRQLVELNTWGDVIWGVRSRIREGATVYLGTNLLGEGLMQVRRMLQNSNLSI